MTAALEFDDDAGCRDDDEGLKCTKKGNLITSSINDRFEASTDFTSPLDNAWEKNGVSGDQYATVHMDVFMPGICEDPILNGAVDCDSGATETETCFESALGNYFLSPADACEETFDFNGEGMFAEGTALSGNRHPKKGNNKSWAMYVDLGEEDPDCSGVTDEFDTGSFCDFAMIVRAIADGGDFGEDGAEDGIDYEDVGDITFTPVDNCQPQCTTFCLP
jgi:hypothetical protein